MQVQLQALPPARAPGQARACQQSRTHPRLRRATQPARSAVHCWSCLRLPRRSCQPADPVQAQHQELAFCVLSCRCLGRRRHIGQTRLQSTSDNRLGQLKLHSYGVSGLGLGLSPSPEISSTSRWIGAPASKGYQAVRERTSLRGNVAKGWMVCRARHSAKTGRDSHGRRRLCRWGCSGR